MQYSVSEGYAPLRQLLADYMGRRGLPCSADNILIANGSQQALDFPGKLFLSPNDRILTASPTYLGALQAFNAYEPLYDALPQPDNDRAPSSYISASGRKPKFA